MDLRFTTAVPCEQAGHVLADDQLRAEAPRVLQNAMKSLTCLASALIDAQTILLPLRVFRRHGLAHEAGHKQVHIRDVAFIASKDVQCPAGVQLADVFEDQGHLWEVLLQPSLLGAITFATERALEDPTAGAAEVLHNSDHRIRATACRPYPP